MRRGASGAALFVASAAAGRRGARRAVARCCSTGAGGGGGGGGGAWSRRSVLRTLSSAAMAGAVGAVGSAAAAAAEDSAVGSIDVAQREPTVTQRVFMELREANGGGGRLTIALYGTVVPRTVANFVRLVEEGRYTGTAVYRVVSGLTVQLGDVLGNGGRRGRAATESGVLAAENFRISHSVPGMVSMVVRDGLVDSRFFVTTRPGDSRYLDGRYVAFGRVERGMDALYQLERVASADRFVRRPPAVRIAACGRLQPR